MFINNRHDSRLLPKILGLVLLVGMTTCLTPAAGYAFDTANPPTFQLTLEAVRNDYQNFYSGHNLLIFSGSLGLAGLMANTSVDEEFQDWYQREMVTATTNDISAAVQGLGDWRYATPAFLAAVLFGELDAQSPVLASVGEWGRRSCRTLLLGGPLTFSLQRIIGASRPGEGDGSKWDPFNDDDGVSGHAFIGAIPFLSAAGMTQNRVGKALWYSASVLPALSRINDDRHYLSQAALGWSIAFLANRSVQQTEQERHDVTLLPWPLPEGGGLLVVGRY
ncbi:MAG: hypothetical protein P8Y91_02105 [Desulfuromonadales bacterium]